MDIVMEVDPKDMSAEQLAACLRVLDTKKRSIESEIERRLKNNQPVSGYRLGLRKDYK